MSYRYPLSTSTWHKEEYDALQSVIESNNFTMGDRVKKYEKNFANFIGSSYSIMVNSGSSANLLMIAALFYTKKNELKLKRGDEIIVPANTYIASVLAISDNGLTPILIEPDINTYNIDFDKIEGKLTSKTKGICLFTCMDK